VEVARLSGNRGWSRVSRVERRETRKEPQYIVMPKIKVMAGAPMCNTSHGGGHAQILESGTVLGDIDPSS
jgi:hypothetical protein